MKNKNIRKICSRCFNYFETDMKFSRICFNCYKKKPTDRQLKIGQKIRKRNKKGAGK